MSIGTIIPDLKNTLGPDAVSRKSFEDKFATAFNSDQIEVLNILISGESSVDLGPLTSALEELTQRVEALESTQNSVPESDETEGE